MYTHIYMRGHLLTLSRQTRVYKVYWMAFQFSKHSTTKFISIELYKSRYNYGFIFIKYALDTSTFLNCVSFEPFKWSAKQNKKALISCISFGNAVWLLLAHLPNILCMCVRSSAREYHLFSTIIMLNDCKFDYIPAVTSWCKSRAEKTKHTFRFISILLFDLYRISTIDCVVWKSWIIKWWDLNLGAFMY